MATSTFDNVSLDNEENGSLPSKSSNAVNNSNDMKSDEVVEVDSKDNNNSSIISNSLDKLRKSAPIYRPQRTESPRHIKITGVEERKLRLSRYHVYIIEVEPSMAGVVNVARRFNDFKWLRLRLQLKFPGIFCPPLPPSKILGRYESDFVEERRKDLERFLNRIEEIKPFSESFELKMFLTRPESTIADGKKEIEDDYSQRTLNDITKDLQDLFPDLHNGTLSELHSSHDIPRLKEFLLKVETCMKTLEMSANKLFTNLASVANEMQVFSESFALLYQAETNYPYKPNIERFDIRKEFDAWSKFQDKQTDIYFDLFLRRLRYEHEDISAFLELFKYRESVEAYHSKLKIKVEKWDALQEASQELSEKQSIQKQKDIDDLKSYESHLVIITKIILNSEMPILWKQKTQDWKISILQFAQKHAQLTEKMIQTWKNMQV